MSQRHQQSPKGHCPDYRRDPCGDVFTCRVCGWPVGPQDAGTRHRNHCPRCLSSVHLDDEPGDRALGLRRHHGAGSGLGAQGGGGMGRDPQVPGVRRAPLNRTAADDNPLCF